LTCSTIKKRAILSNAPETGNESTFTEKGALENILQIGQIFQTTQSYRNCRRVCIQEKKTKRTDMLSTECELCSVGSRTSIETYLQPDTVSYCSFSPQNSKCCTLLHAVHWNQLDVVRVLLEMKADAAGAEQGTTRFQPLHLSRGSYVTKLLLDLNADINCTTLENGWTPLMLATFCGRTDIVRLLLDQGADTNLADHMGVSALDAQHSFTTHKDKINQCKQWIAQSLSERLDHTLRSVLSTDTARLVLSFIVDARFLKNRQYPTG
jgi:uncharacterized protein